VYLVVAFAERACFIERLRWFGTEDPDYRRYGDAHFGPARAADTRS
jgi:hypothetical protein